MLHYIALRYIAWHLHYITLHTLHCIALHYITIHYITLHYIHYIHYITVHYITLHCIALHCIALHHITKRYITLHYVTYIPFHSILLRYVTLHYITLHYIHYTHYKTLYYITLHYVRYIRVSSKSVKQECPARASSKRVLSRVPCKTLLFLDDCASHLHKEKTSIFIFALVSVYSALHKVTAFGFVGSIRFFVGAHLWRTWEPSITLCLGSTPLTLLKGRQHRSRLHEVIKPNTTWSSLLGIV